MEGLEVILMWAQGREPLSKRTQQREWAQNYVESLPVFSHWFGGWGEPTPRASNDNKAT